MNKGTNKTKQTQTRRYRQQSRREEGNGSGAGVKWAKAIHIWWQIETKSLVVACCSVYRNRKILLYPWSLYNSIHQCCCCSVIQSCLTLCDPMVCSPPGSSVHGILQARIPEWVAISFSRGSSQPRDGCRVSCAAGDLLHCRWILYWLSHQGTPVLP